jgi:hypothetical protein
LASNRPFNTWFIVHMHVTVRTQEVLIQNKLKLKLKLDWTVCFSFPLLHGINYTPLTVVSRTCKTLRISTTATIAQIPAVSSKEGAVIAAVLNHCAMPSIGQTWGLASIGAVVEMGILSTLKLLMESMYMAYCIRPTVYRESTTEDRIRNLMGHCLS